MVVTTTSAAAPRSRFSTGSSASAKASRRSCWSAQHARVDLVQQVVLGAEVVVQRPLGDAGRLDDLLHRGAVVALLGEEPGGGGQQPLRDGGPVAVRRPGHCRHLPSRASGSAVWPSCVRERSSRRRIFPLVVFGRSGRISTSRGYL